LKGAKNKKVCRLLVFSYSFFSPYLSHIYSDDDRKYCRAIGGVKGQKFEIVRENEYLVVAKAKTGVMFTGDFPHAGVRNIIHGTEEDRLMEVLYDRIDRVLQECHAEDNLAKTKAVIDILCNFPGLNKLCRFHCSTEFISGRLSIPQNTIGFSECLPNSPDERCLQDESPSKDFDEKKKKKKEEAGPDKKTIKLRDALESEKEDWDDEADDSSDYDPDEEIDDGGFWTWSSPKRSPSTF